MAIDRRTVLTLTCCRDRAAYDDGNKFLHARTTATHQRLEKVPVRHMFTAQMRIIRVYFVQKFLKTCVSALSGLLLPRTRTLLGGSAEGTIPKPTRAATSSTPTLPSSTRATAWGFSISGRRFQRGRGRGTGEKTKKCAFGCAGFGGGR